MKTFKNAKKELNRLFDTLLENNICTAEDLKKSEYASETWMVIHDFAESMVFTNSAKTNCVGFYNFFDSEDWTTTLCIEIMSNFDSLMRTFSTERIDKKTGKKLTHNYSGYLYALFLSCLWKEKKKYIIKDHQEYIDENNKKHRRLMPVTETDKNGYTYTKKYQFRSGNIGLDPNDPDSPCYFDTVESDSRTEHDMDQAEDDAESNQHLYEHFLSIYSHKNKKMVFTFIEDTLLFNDLPCSLPYLLESFRNFELLSVDCRNKAIHDILDAYNIDLIFFMNCIGISDMNIIEKYFAKDMNEFGAKFSPKSEEDFRAALSRYRYRYKQKLAERLNIKPDRQVRRKKAA